MTPSCLLLVCALCGCSLMSGKHRDAGDLVISRQFTQRGLSDLRNGRVEDAEQHFSEAVRSCPVDSMARKLYAEALWKRGAQAEAIQQMHESVRLSGPFDVTHVVRLGEMHLQLGELALAERQARDAIRMATDDPSGWVLRARVQRAEGNLELALADFHRALAYDPDHLAVRLEVAELYNLISRPQRSLAMLHALTEQVAEQELPPQAAVLEGVALQQLNRHRDAIEAFAHALQRGASAGELLIWSADSYLALGLTEQAEWAVAEAERAAASPEMVHEMRGRIAAHATDAATTFR